MKLQAAPTAASQFDITTDYQWGQFTALAYELRQETEDSLVVFHAGEKIMITNEPLEEARKDLEQSQEELDHLAQKLDEKEKEHERKGPLAAILPGQEATNEGPHRPGLG